MTRTPSIARRLVSGILGSLVFGAAFAAGPRIAEFDRLKELRYYEARVAAKRIEAAALPKTAQTRQQRYALLSGPLQHLGAQRSFVGDVDGALDALDESRQLALPPPRPAHPEELARIDAAVPMDALSAIVKEARSRQVVILNENHHVPAHRAFAMRLARELRKLGYTHLAAETFSPDPVAREHVRRGSGFYTQEPVFANFVRAAAKDGWTLVHYEAPHSDPKLGLSAAEQDNQRELGQARNLVDRILATNPKAKIFVYVGYGHAQKTTVTGGMRMMADHFKELSGIDPLTVDQMLMVAHPRPDAEHSLYRAIAGKGRDQPFVLRDRNGKYEVFAAPPGAYDMQMIHPDWPIDAKTGRRTWLSALAGFKPHPVPKALLPTTGRRLVMAMRPKAVPGETPLDAILLEPRKKPPMLMLPDGPFELTSRDESGDAP